MGVYNIIYGALADNVVGATSTTYATARAMTSPTLGTVGALTLSISLNASTRGVGNEFVTPNYNCVQGFIAFNTSSVVGPITSATLTLVAQTDISTTDFTIEARLKDWGLTVDTGDAVAGANLSALPLLATLATSTLAGAGRYSFTDVALGTNINTSDFTRILLCSDGQTNNTTPTTPSYVAFTAADNTGTTNDPRLDIYLGSPWAFVGVSDEVAVATTAHALVTTGISGLAAGDLLVACITSRIASTTSVTLPTGGEWTLVAEQKSNNVLTTTSAAASGLMAYCVRGASNPNLTFTHPVAPSQA